MAAVIGAVLIASIALSPLLTSQLVTAKDTICKNCKVAKIIAKNAKLEDIDHLTIEFPTVTGSAYNDTGLVKKTDSLQTQLDAFGQLLQNISKSAITSIEVSDGGAGNESSGGGTAGGNTSSTGNETGTVFGNSTNSTG